MGLFFVFTKYEEREIMFIRVSLSICACISHLSKCGQLKANFMIFLIWYFSVLSYLLTLMLFKPVWRSLLVCSLEVDVTTFWVDRVQCIEEKTQWKSTLTGEGKKVIHVWINVRASKLHNFNYWVNRKSYVECIQSLSFVLYVDITLNFT